MDNLGTGNCSRISFWWITGVFVLSLAVCSVISTAPKMHAKADQINAVRALTAAVWLLKNDTGTSTRDEQYSYVFCADGKFEINVVGGSKKIMRPVCNGWWQIDDLHRLRLQFAEGARLDYQIISLSTRRMVLEYHGIWHGRRQKIRKDFETTAQKITTQ